MSYCQAAITMSNPTDSEGGAAGARALELAAVLRVIVKLAPGLRAAGVFRIEVDGVRAEMEPMQSAAGEKLPPRPSDPMKDPDTFGRNDGSVPGLRRWEEYDG